MVSAFQRASHGEDFRCMFQWLLGCNLGHECLCGCLAYVCHIQGIHRTEGILKMCQAKH